jgi:hypothetical protein
VNAPSHWKQLTALTTRAWTAAWRDPSYNVTRIVLTLLVNTALGAIFRDVAADRNDYAEVQVSGWSRDALAGCRCTRG